MAFEDENREQEGYRDTRYSEPMSPAPADLPTEQPGENSRTERAQNDRELGIHPFITSRSWTSIEMPEPIPARSCKNL